MRMERINTWLSLSGNIAILLGLVAVAIEIGGNTAAMRIQVMDNAVAADLDRSLVIATSPELRDLYVKALFNPSELTLADTWGISAYFGQRTTVIKSKYLRYVDGATTSADWEDTKRQAAYFLGTEFGRKYWSARRADFSNIPQFVATIDAELANTDLVPNDEWLLELHEELTGARQ